MQYREWDGLGCFDGRLWIFVAVRRGSGVVRGIRVPMKGGKWEAGARGGARGACLAASLRALQGGIFCLLLMVGLFLLTWTQPVTEVEGEG